MGDRQESALEKKYTNTDKVIAMYGINNFKTQEICSFKISYVIILCI